MLPGKVGPKFFGTVLVLAALLGSAAQASTSLVTSAASLGANDSVSWSQLGPDGSSINPIVFVAHSTAGLTVFGSSLQNLAPSLTLVTQGSTFSGTFTNGARLLSTGPGTGPLTFSFLTPVSGAGVEIQRNLYGSFIAQISAFDGMGHALQANLFDYQAGGFSSSTGNPPVFLGVSSTSADIAKIELQVLPATGISSTGFAIDSLQLVNPAVAPVPEPTTYAMLVAGLGLMGVLAGRKQNRLE